MLRIYVLAEKPRSDPANERCSPFDGILPKRLIDGGIVNDADQIAQPLTILANACRRNRIRGRSQMRRRIHSKNCFHSKVLRWALERAVPARMIIRLQSTSLEPRPATFQLHPRPRHRQSVCV